MNVGSQRWLAAWPRWLFLSLLVAFAQLVVSFGVRPLSSLPDGAYSALGWLGAALAFAGLGTSLAARRAGPLSLITVAASFALISAYGAMRDSGLGPTLDTLLTTALDLAVRSAAGSVVGLGAAAIGAGVAFPGDRALAQFGARSIYVLGRVIGFQLVFPGLTLVLLATYLDAALVVEPSSLRAVSGAIRAIGRRPLGPVLALSGSVVSLTTYAVVDAVVLGPDIMFGELFLPTLGNPWLQAGMGMVDTLIVSWVGCVLGAWYVGAQALAPPAGRIDPSNPFAG